MSKKINENDEPEKIGQQGSAETILVKYKKKERDLDEQKAHEDKEHKKRILKEKQRLMGRRMPTKDDNEHERELQIIATKGVVQLFNAVAEFQTSMATEAFKEDREKRRLKSEAIQAVGTDKATGAVGFDQRQSLVQKIQSTQRRWKVLESDSEDADGNINIVDDVD